MILYYSHNNENSYFLILFTEPPSPPKDMKLYEIQSKSARISWQVISFDAETSSSMKNNFDASQNVMDDPPINEYIIQYTHISGNIYNHIVLYTIVNMYN